MLERKQQPPFVKYTKEGFGGTKQIRTAVIGFADRCLATRPWYPLYWECKNKFFFWCCQIYFTVLGQVK